MRTEQRIERGGAPVLFSVQGRVLTVVVPDGVGRVVVEERMAKGGRTLRSVRSIAPGHLEITLPRPIPRGRLRVWGFPNGSEETPGGVGGEAPEETRYFDLGAPLGGLIGRGGDAVTLATQGDAPEGGAGSKEVVEPDLWSQKGSRLYFFNPYRGLQVLDVKDPDAPALVAATRVGIDGDSLFVLPGGEAVLVGHKRGIWRNGASRSAVVVVGDQGVQAELELEGAVEESRMVGTTLYVAAEFSRWEKGVWKGGTEVTAIDLQRPSAPVVLDSMRIEGWGNAVAATPDLLLVAVHSGGASAVHVIRLSEGSGALVSAGVARLGGTVADRFKLSVDKGVLRAVSEVSGRNEQGRWETVSRLETFDLSGGGEFRRLGSLELAPGERLYATRFDKDRAYVVTFFQVDPLWVVDLSDPGRPSVKGHLEVPGFSTHIEPVGNLLVTVGYLDWATAVSLFDVSDPAQPKTLGQVTLEGYSEATGDDKAFTVLKDRGLALVPTVGWGGAGTVGAVRLVDFGTEGLRVRGAVEGRFHPRRTMALGERIAAISATVYMTLDAADRDRPEIVSEVALAWPVDRVFAAGDHLLEVDDGRSDVGSGAGVTVAKRSDPDEAVGGVDLDGGVVIGAAMRDEYLYVLQEEEGGALVLTVCDGRRLPELAIVGRVVSAEQVTGAQSARAHWLRSGVLVWEVSGGSYHWWEGGAVSKVTDTATEVSRIGIPWMRPMGNTKRLVACWVPKAGTPRFGPVVELPRETTGYWTVFGASVAEGDRVLTSRRVQADVGVVVPMKNAKSGLYAARHWVDAVDFSDPSMPVLAPPVNVPGELVGVADGGGLIFTISGGFRSEKGEYKGTTLQALSFDGKTAGLLGVVSVPGAFAGCVAQTGAKRFVVAIEGKEAKLVALRWDAAGWVREKEATVDAGILSLRVFGGHLAAVWVWPAGVGVFDSAGLGLLRKGPAPGWSQPDLRGADLAADGGLWVPFGLHGVIAY